MGRFFKCRISRVNCIPQTVICSDATPYPPISSVYTNGTQIRRGTKAKRWWPSGARRGMLYTQSLFIRNEDILIFSSLLYEPFLGSFLTPIENFKNWLVAGWGFDTSRKTITILKIVILLYCIMFYPKNYSKKIPLEIFDLSSFVIVSVIMHL